MTPAAATPLDDPVVPSCLVSHCPSFRLDALEVGVGALPATASGLPPDGYLGVSLYAPGGVPLIPRLLTGCQDTLSRKAGPTGPSFRYAWDQPELELPVRVSALQPGSRLRLELYLDGRLAGRRDVPLFSHPQRDASELLSGQVVVGIDAEVAAEEEREGKGDREGLRGLSGAETFAADVPPMASVAPAAPNTPNAPRLPAAPCTLFFTFQTRTAAKVEYCPSGLLDLKSPPYIVTSIAQSPQLTKFPGLTAEELGDVARLALTDSRVAAPEAGRAVPQRQGYREHIACSLLDQRRSVCDAHFLALLQMTAPRASLEPVGAPVSLQTGLFVRRSAEGKRAAEGAAKLPESVTGFDYNSELNFIMPSGPVLSAASAVAAEQFSALEKPSGLPGGDSTLDPGDRDPRDSTALLLAGSALSDATMASVISSVAMSERTAFTTSSQTSYFYKEAERQQIVDLTRRAVRGCDGCEGGEGREGREEHGAPAPAPAGNWDVLPRGRADTFSSVLETRSAFYNPTDYCTLLSRVEASRDGGAFFGQLPGIRYKLADAIRIASKRRERDSELVPTRAETRTLEAIRTLSYSSPLNADRRALCWRYRYWLRRWPDVILRVIESSPYLIEDGGELRERVIGNLMGGWMGSETGFSDGLSPSHELALLLTTWKQPAQHQIFYLLTEPYARLPAVRGFALSSLLCMRDEELGKYLMEVSLKIGADSRACSSVLGGGKYRQVFAELDRFRTVQSGDSAYGAELLYSLLTEFPGQGVAGALGATDIAASRGPRPGVPSASAHRAELGAEPAPLEVPIAQGYPHVAEALQSLAAILIYRASKNPYLYYTLYFYIDLWRQDAKERDRSPQYDRLNDACECYLKLMKETCPTFYEELQDTIQLTKELVDLAVSIKKVAKGRTEQKSLLMECLRKGRFSKPEVIPGEKKKDAGQDTLSTLKDFPLTHLCNPERPIIFPFVSPQGSNKAGGRAHAASREPHFLESSAADSKAVSEPETELYESSSIEPIPAAGAAFSSPAALPGLAGLPPLPSQPGPAGQPEAAAPKFVRVSGVLPEESHVFKSAKKPFKITLRESESGRGIPILFKIYDDVRLDMHVLHMFGAMDALLQNHNLDLRFSVYNTFALSPNSGIVECVLPSASTDEILGNKQWGTIQRYLAVHSAMRSAAQAGAQSGAQVTAHQSPQSAPLPASRSAAPSVSLAGVSTTPLSAPLAARSGPEAGTATDVEAGIEAEADAEAGTEAEAGADTNTEERAGASAEVDPEAIPETKGVAQESATAGTSSDSPAEEPVRGERVEGAERTEREEAPVADKESRKKRPRAGSSRAETSVPSAPPARAGRPGQPTDAVPTPSVLQELSPPAPSAGTSTAAASAPPSASLAVAGEIPAEAGVTEKQLENFIRSTAGYSVATYLLAIGDRHGENILIRPDGKLFHIDFGWCFGRDPKPYPPLMKINKELVDAMGGVESPGFGRFMSYVLESFLLLRQECRLFICLINMLRGGGISVLEEEAANSFFVIEDKFRLDLNNDDASYHITEVVRECMNAILPQLIDAFHRWVQSMRK